MYGLTYLQIRSTIEAECDEPSTQGRRSFLMPNKITTTLEAVNGGLNFFILTGKHDVFAFENGKRTQDRIGTGLTGALPGNRLATITVKIKGADPLENIPDEKISAACAAMKFPLVKFTDCVVTLYNMNGQLGMTATSSGCALINGGK